MLKILRLIDKNGEQAEVGSAILEKRNRKPQLSDIEKACTAFIKKPGALLIGPGLPARLFKSLNNVHYQTWFLALAV